MLFGGEGFCYCIGIVVIGCLIVVICGFYWCVNSYFIVVYCNDSGCFGDYFLVFDVFNECVILLVVVGGILLIIVICIWLLVNDKNVLVELCSNIFEFSEFWVGCM